MSFQNQFSRCPRCQDQSFEHLQSYGFCANCQYSSDDEVTSHAVMPRWAKSAPRRTSKFRAKRKMLAIMIGALSISALSACSTAKPFPDSRPDRTQQIHNRHMNRR